MPRRVHLHSWHIKHARMTNFAGFFMPLWYEGIVPEHLAVRNSVGVFDVTHMGRCIVQGEDAERFLNYVTTNDVRKLKDLQVQYTLMCNPRGGIKDDLTICRLEPNRYWLVYNASNREKDFRWLVSHSEGFDVRLTDVSDEVVMLALQGPKAQQILEPLTPVDLRTIHRFHGQWVEPVSYTHLTLPTTERV